MNGLTPGSRVTVTRPDGRQVHWVINDPRETGVVQKFGGPNNAPLSYLEKLGKVTPGWIGER